MDADFCVAALNQAMARYGVPAIFNTDQGSQFTSCAFLELLQDAVVAISIGWPGALEGQRLWRTLKYEDIYLKSYESVRELKRGIAWYFRFYNQRRFHQSLECQTPEEMYESFKIESVVTAA